MFKRLSDHFPSSSMGASFESLEVLRFGVDRDRAGATNADILLFQDR
jgi:hypothetical protein